MDSIQRGRILLMVGVALCGCGSALLAPDSGAGGGPADARDDQATGTGGTTGAAGTSGAGGRGGATGGAGGSLPLCTSDTLTDPAMSAADFCAIFLNGCSGVPGFTIPSGYTTVAMCETSYAALTEATRMCRSYHLCTAVAPNMNTTMAHCLHATGTGECIGN